eukprot:scaffold2051_cov389-Prasinococcus_capsulatus_cf.AAC.7
MASRFGDQYSRASDDDAKLVDRSTIDGQKRRTWRCRQCMWALACLLRRSRRSRRSLRGFAHTQRQTIWLQNWTQQLFQVPKRPKDAGGPGSVAVIDLAVGLSCCYRLAVSTQLLLYTFGSALLLRVGLSRISTRGEAHSAQWPGGVDLAQIGRQARNERPTLCSAMGWSLREGFRGHSMATATRRLGAFSERWPVRKPPAATRPGGAGHAEAPMRRTTRASMALGPAIGQLRR